MRLASEWDGKWEVFDWHDARLRIDISKAKKMVGAPYARPDGRIAIVDVIDSGVSIKPEHALTVNLSWPVIVGCIGGWHFLIDGNHRACLANWRKRRTLPCYAMTEAETASCALHWRHPIYDKDRFNEVARLFQALSNPVRILPL